MKEVRHISLAFAADKRYISITMDDRFARLNAAQVDAMIDTLEAHRHDMETPEREAAGCKHP